IAKVYQQPIAQMLGNLPCEAVDRLSTHLMIGLYHLPPLFRIELLRERSRAHQVAKHHRQLAAFCFQCRSLRPGRGGPGGRLRCPSWGVGAFVRTALRWGQLSFCCEGCATFPTELGSGPHLLATAWAGPHQFCPAFLTELQPLGILKPTARATHGASLLLQTPWGKEDTCSLRDEPLHLRVDSGVSPVPRATCLRLCAGRLWHPGGPALPGARPPRGYTAGRALPPAGAGSPLAWCLGQVDRGVRTSKPRSSAWGYPKQGWGLRYPRVPSSTSVILRPHGPGNLACVRRGFGS